MLKGIFSITALVLFASLAQAFDQAALSPLIDTYAEVNSVDLVEEHYWLALSTDESSLAQDLRRSPRCQDEANFSITTPVAIATRLSAQIHEGIRIGFQNPIEKNSLFAQTDEAVQTLTEAIAKTMITVCIDDTAPEYSDEHVVHFVRVDGELCFAFAMGRPD